MLQYCDNTLEGEISNDMHSDILLYSEIDPHDTIEEFPGTYSLITIPLEPTAEEEAFQTYSESQPMLPSPLQQQSQPTDFTSIPHSTESTSIQIMQYCDNTLESEISNGVHANISLYSEIDPHDTIEEFPGTYSVITIPLGPTAEEEAFQTYSESQPISPSPLQQQSQLIDFTSIPYPTESTFVHLEQLSSGYFNNALRSEILNGMYSDISLIDPRCTIQPLLTTSIYNNGKLLPHEMTQQICNLVLGIIKKLHSNYFPKSFQDHEKVCDQSFSNAETSNITACAILTGFQPQSSQQPILNFGVTVIGDYLMNEQYQVLVTNLCN
ncbi:unnamed protein product [Cercopithifilaria johnstoni]|uniref:Uncharacterized protein n=1 Tax=Cercopithifilaria johnstoni TaxID=2874296 RepID=A0A8J2LTT3_9BILA|nr:unnamed protein product [Cercopithifilaria johnstoni]